MNFVNERRRLLFAFALVTLVLIVVVGPDYGALQTVRTADGFRTLANEGTGRYVAAGLIDLGFAAAYGVAALSMPMTPMASRIGAYLVVLGAVADEAENAILLRNIAVRADLSDTSVDLMRTFGHVKWALILTGLALLFGGLLWQRRADIGAWIGTSIAWYAAFLGLVFLMVPIAYLRLPWPWLWLVPVLAALAYVGSRLNDVVRQDRASAASHGIARTLLATLQLAVGGLLAYLGYNLRGWHADIAFFLGVALIVMSLGAYISELRESAPFPTRRGLVLVLGGLVVLAYAAITDRSAAVTLAIAGIVAGEIGTEFLSRDFLRWALPIPNWSVGGVGVIVLTVGASLFVATGVDPGHVVFVIGALAAVVYFASADGDALIIVLLAAYALVWAVSPHEASVEADRLPVEGKPYFVVFGDSYISGEGAETFIEGTNEKVRPDDPDRTYENECRRATTAWPFVVADLAAENKSTTVPSRVMFLGCSGAVSENISTLPRRNSKGERQGPAELDVFLKQKNHLKLDPPEFVVISIGGNDAGFGDIGKTCVTPGNCAEVGEQFLRGRDADEPQKEDGPPGSGKAESLVDIRDDLRAAYARVRRVVGDVPIIAVPYPTPLTESGRCRGVLLEADERRFIRGFVPELNGVIVDVATEPDNGLFVLEGMQDGLRGVGAQLCSNVAGRAGLNFFALNPTSGSLADSLNPKNWVHNSLHPNAVGHKALANVAYAWLSKNLPLSEPPPHQPHAISPIRTVLDGAFVTQCNIGDRASCDIDKGDWVGEQVHNFLGRALFPLAVVMFGLWLCINPMLRWAATKSPPVTLASIMWPGLRDAAVKMRSWVGWLWNGP